MDKIGIRELRQHASRYLRRVRAGEIITITEHGEPIAEIRPLPQDETPIRQLEREGNITRATADLLELAPMMPADEHPPLSEILEEMRAAERF